MLAAFLLFATACTAATPPAAPTTASSTSPTQSVADGGTVTERILGGWASLDPQATGSADSSQITSGLYDYLVALVDGKVVPYLATSWTQTPTSVTFTLRRDATCADGAPVTPTVVANSFKRLTTNPNAGRLVRAYGPGPYTITADDAASTVTFAISQPFAGLLYAFSTPSGAIVCPAGLANPDSLATSSSGSGPFVIESSVSGDSITLAARPDWKWGPNGLTTKSSGFPQKVVYKVIANDTTAANLLLTGGLDVSIINGTDNGRIAADTTLTHKAAHGYFAIDILFNEQEGRPGMDQAVRQALATTINPTDFGKAAYYASTVTTSYLAPDAQCFDPTTKSLIPEANPAKAKQIMIDAGYQLGPDGKFLDKAGNPLTINVAGSLNQNNGPDYLADRFMAAGFDVNLNKTERGTYAQAYLAGNFDVAISETAADTPDPNGSGSIGLFTGIPAPQGSNASYMDYPSIDAEINAANAASGDDACKHWANVQQELLTRFVILPTVVVDYQWHSRNIDLVGLQSRSIDPMFLKRVP
jgi:peptide/nickel transport system substrate-binding protein